MRAELLKILIFMVFFLFCAGPVQAQQEFVDMTKIQEIPDFSHEMPDELWMQESELYREEPMGDKFLAYNVRLPIGWYKASAPANLSFNMDEIESAGLSQRILGQVAQYYGPGRIEALSKFEIQAQSLEFEVTAKNWFMQEILSRGFSLEGLKVYSDKRVEALYVVVEGDTSYVVRAVAEINGPRMVVASYYVPDMFWEKERGFQQRTIESFHFVSPERTKIEITRTYAFLDLLSFDYPASWRLIAPNIYSIDGMEAKLIHSVDNSTLGGEIHISVISTEFGGALADEIKYLREEMQGRGLVIGDLIETKSDYEKPEHILYNHTERYRAVDSDSKVLEHEYWISIMEEERYFYVITMITPGRKSEFYTWARNGEAFETIVESFQP